MGASVGATQRAGVRHRIRVLVVDDSVDHRTLIAQRLAAAGMQVATASDAEEALVACDDVELVLLDYRLPRVSGLEVLAAIRERPRPPSVIMVTGAGSTEVAVDAMRAGAVNYIAKDHGYVRALPEVVERAWRNHDLTERAAEVQRLALLVTSATDRDALFDEIVSGAARLLRAASCSLVIEEGGRLEHVAAHGADPGDLIDLVTLDLDVDGGGEPWMADSRLIIPLPSDTGEPVGALSLSCDDDAFTHEEVELAKVFASFAGIALRNLRQFELERRLVTELQQTLDARQDFVASISHELRTPLTAIAGFTATLEEHWGRLDDDRRSDLLSRVGRNAVQLRTMVDELLDVASLERGLDAQTDVEPLVLGDEVAEALEQLEHVLDGREVRVDVGQLRVEADVTKLRRVLGNLLSNAVKFSEPGTPIEVHARRDGAMVRIEVRDRGVGLSEWEAARVFDPFFRARSSVTNAVRGSGIGLALVRSYVRAMGGDVEVASAPGEGSTFTVSLRAA
jgi:signal transduction histidine kinase